MTHDTDTAQSGKKIKKTAAQERELRLKAALKSNMGRRKAQARARVSTDDDAQDITNEKKD
ncbi:hypothetical protein [Halocynthiibacter namhaensis]|uniref:hypothetical protein n=1 Tax=Halocynthiibacter namhaensis TaxID=1290553 RepID=UPI0005796BCC|nr:hypothetical protein [Halocynthiibacter namhaensis]